MRIFVFMTFFFLCAEKISLGHGLSGTGTVNAKTCRMMHSNVCIPEKALNASLQISTLEVPSGNDRCSTECYHEPLCVSYNDGPTSEDGLTEMCELFATDHVDSTVVERPGYKYCSFVNPCSLSPCPSNKRCKPDFVEDENSFTCVPACGPLGMEDRRIQDSQINSSSDWDGFHRAALARLHNEMSGGDKGAWSAKEKQIGEYLQIDLGQVTWITHAATQGRHEIDREINQWVMSYKLTYSDDGAEWKEYKEAGQTKVFSANRDRDSVVTNPLFPAIKSRYIRFLPLTWYKHISMRVEIYGCGL